MRCTKNGLTYDASKRQRGDDPVRVIVGGDFSRSAGSRIFTIPQSPRARADEVIE
jgi:hypothetical protein